MTNGAVIVTGVIPESEAHGLEEGVAEFNDHHSKVAVALMNIAEHKNPKNPRPVYKHQSYPTRLYHADGRDFVAEDEEQKERAEQRGFRAEPYLKPVIAVLDPKVEKAQLETKLAAKDGQINTLNDQLQRLEQRFASMEAKEIEAEQKKKK